ncbi:MAG TPA: GDSL-type esterase/lipase family protein [Candidatus Paceibacterota bacterium]
MENKNKFYLAFGVIILLLLFYFFAFGKSQDIKNYPSNGSDIVAFGDSLIEGVGSTSGNDFISVLSKKIGRPIINLGVSGNTTEDGLNRIGELDKYSPKVVILLLGGNDHLKKVPIDTTFNNLSKIIENIQSRGSIVLVLGIRGNLLGDKFKDRFEELEDEYDTAYVSDVLSGLFTNTRLMSDAVHPNDLGYIKIADRVYPVLEKLLK